MSVNIAIPLDSLYLEDVLRKNYVYPCQVVCTKKQWYE